MAGRIKNDILSQFRLEGRTALVTGGAGAIGSAFAKTLLELGADVVLLDRDIDRLTATAKALDGSERLTSVCADLADPVETTAAVEHVLRDNDRLDILINNAAFTGATTLGGYAVPLADQTVDAWDAAMRVNLTAAFQLCQLLRQPLSRSGKGVIVNVSSIYGVVGPDRSLYEGTQMGNPVAYGASKAALIQMTRYLAAELAPSIRVNALSPGGVSRGQPAPFQHRYCARTPMARMATEQDLQGALAFLVGDASSYVTGHNLVVDGGFTAW